MQKKIVGILVCMLFLISAFSTVTIAKTFFIQEENHNLKLHGLIFLSGTPYLPSNPNPPNESTNVNVNTDLGWDGGDPDTDETVYYDVYLGIESNPPFIEQIGPYPADQTRITYDLEKLNYNMQYYWRIDAIDSYGYTTTGPSWAYTTVDDQPPYQPSNPNPANGSTDVAANINLSWTGGDPDLGDVVKYDVYFGTDPNPPNVVLKQLETMYGLGILDGDTQYYWRIDAWDDYGYSVTGETWTFRTEMQPNKPATPSGKINGKAGTEYIYTSNTTDPDGDQVYYWFDWGDNTNSGWLGPFDSGETASAKHVWTVKGDYEIKVKAKDVYDAESEWSDSLPISMPKNKAVAKNKAKGVFQADLGLGNEGDAKISLNGQYRTFGSFRIFGGTGNLTGTDKTGRFQGLSTKSYFIIQTAVNSQIINIVGKYTSYNEEEQTFNGICRGLTGRIRGTTGWITGSFS